MQAVYWQNLYGWSDSVDGMMSSQEQSTALLQGISCICWTHRRLQLAIDAHCAKRWVGGKTLVPLTGPRIRYWLHEAPLQLTDAGVVTHDLSLGLIQVLQREGTSQNW